MAKGLFDQLLEDSAPKPAAQAPSAPVAEAPAPMSQTQAAGVVGAPAAAAPAAPKEDNSLFGQMLKEHAAGSPVPMPSTPEGVFPTKPIQESPLSLIDRARLGHVRTPEKQMALLADQYGKDNVKLIKDGSEASLVVKHEGKWHSVDPAFSWDFSGKGMMAGAAAGAAVGGIPGAVAGGIAGLVGPSIIKNGKDLPGDIAQFTGEYGLRSAAAAAAAPSGVAAGAAAGTPLGPYGMAAGGAIGGLAAAAAGAFGAEALDQGSRKLAGDNSGAQSKEELAQQLYSSMLFGMNQEAMGGVTKLGAKAGIKALSSTLEHISDTPAGRQVAAKIYGAISGLGENLARVRIEDPAAVARFDSIAADDATHVTDNLGNHMKDKVQGVLDTFYKRKNQLFGQAYDGVEDVAKTLKYAPTEANNALTKELTDSGYIKNGNPINYRGSADVERNIGNEEAGVIRYVTGSVQRMNNKLAKGAPISFDELRRFTQQMDSDLNGAGGQALTDLNLKRILNDHVTALKNHIMDVVGDKDPALANKFAELNSKYGPVKEMLGKLSDVSEPNRVDAFIKQIVKDDGSYNSSLLSNLSDALGTADPSKEILQMHVAKQSTNFFGGKIAGKLPFGLAGPAKAAVTAASSVKQNSNQFLSGLVDTIPYADKANQMLRSLSPQAKKALRGNPAAMDAMSRIIGGGVVGEKQMSQDLLQSHGVVPTSGPIIGPGQ